MDLKESLRKLDQTILFADFEKALHHYFSKKVKTIFKDNLIEGLSYKMKLLQSFLLEVEEIKEITLHKQFIQSPETFSLFTFRFELHNGKEVALYEIIRRKWKKDKVVEEEFWINPSQQVLDLLENNGSEKVREEEEMEKVDEPYRTEVIPLTEIKGIGPKSAALFKQEGIENVNQLAALSLEELSYLTNKLNFRSPYLQPEYLLEEAARLSRL